MTKKIRKRREYLRYLDKSKESAECAIENFNRVKGSFKFESTLILLSVAWELLAKAILIQSKNEIKKSKSEDSISAEIAVHKLVALEKIGKHHSDIIQQVISLRNAAVHDLLPPIPIEVQYHLMYYTCKFYREILTTHFSSQANDISQNYLSLSFGEMTTYSDKVQKLVSRVKKDEDSKRLIWLLERGVKFDGGKYLTLQSFDTIIKDKRKSLSYLDLGKYLKESDMVRIVPIEAPKNYTADLTLRRGNKNDNSLPVVVKKTDLEKDYPYLTSDLARILDKSVAFVSKFLKVMNYKDNEKYHQTIRTSKTGVVNRYSEVARSGLLKKLKDEPNFNPYKV